VVARTADVVVIGAGVVGLATARALAQEGRDVVLLEQHAVGHERGSSHGTSRIFRLAYPDERFVRLAQSALSGWRELEAECGRTLIVHTGGLDVGPDTTEIARGLSGCGVAFELLAGRDAAHRWPVAFAPSEQVLFQSDGGIIRADQAVAALAEGARASGAELQEEALVAAIVPQARIVRVQVEGRVLGARAVVVTAGAWARQLLAPLGIELGVVPTRETVSYFSVPSAHELPPLIDWTATAESAHGVLRPGQASYALPAPGVGLKAGLHHSGPVADPEELAGPEDAAVRRTAGWIARRYPEANASPLASETCLYTNTADESFVLERHGRVVVGSACSGHGFKFAPALARTLAGLAGEAVG
jgi:sarcosine oxidase